MAKLDMNFAVEKVTAEVEYRPGDPIKKTEVHKVARTEPEDRKMKMKAIAFSAIALVSGFVWLFFNYFYERKCNTGKE